jgi:pSer/pThr/pTyr-binding forkhead associated (FHA) protein
VVGKPLGTGGGFPRAAADETLSQNDARDVVARSARPEPHLVLALECDRPLAGAARHSLAGVDEVLVGRGPERTAIRHFAEGARRLTLAIPDPRISGTHARLRRSGGRFFLEDAGSRNGCFLNGARVERAAVSDDDVIELGHTLFQVAYALPTPEGTPVDVDPGDSGDLAGGFATLLPDLATAFAKVQRVADSRTSILLGGDTGTGKEVVARRIHALSGRQGPFVAVNCAALPEALVESQLFGHVRGAFSGALRDEPGLVRASSGGTLLLDEVGDLAPRAQAALLRVLQESEVLPVGATRPVPVDLRVIAATHRRLDTLVESREFRADLFARLSGFSFVLPALHARRPDIGLLVASILRDVAGDAQATLTVPAGRALLRYRWPFNVRELRQCLALAVSLAKGAPVEPAHLGKPVEAEDAAPAGPSERDRPALTAESTQLRDELIAQLRLHRGNVTEVAQALGRARIQVYRWMSRFDLDPLAFRRNGDANGANETRLPTRDRKESTRGK